MGLPVEQYIHVTVYYRVGVNADFSIGLPWLHFYYVTVYHFTGNAGCFNPVIIIAKQRRRVCITITWIVNTHRRHLADSCKLPVIRALLYLVLLYLVFIFYIPYYQNRLL